MKLFEIFLTGVALAMDAFAVSICKGIKMKKLKWSHLVIIAIFFGGFQMLMPLIGWLLGSQLVQYIEAFDHWIAFVLLAIIGGNMIKESLDKDTCEMDPDFSFKTMLMMAIATSIDALAVGVSFAFLKVNIWTAILVIGLTTAAFSGVGLKLGNVFGCRYKSKAELAGGIILVLIGLKILIEHLLA